MLITTKVKNKEIRKIYYFVELILQDESIKYYKEKVFLCKFLTENRMINEDIALKYYRQLVFTKNFKLSA